MQIKRRRFERGMILHIVGNVTSATAAELDDELFGLAKRRGALIIVELSAVPMVTSAGLGALLKCYRQLQENGGRLLLCAISEEVAEVLEISGLNRLFELFPDLNEAKAAALTTRSGEPT